MKLIRFGEAGKEKPGLELENGKRIDVSEFIKDYDETFFQYGGLNDLKMRLNTSEFNECPEVSADMRLGPPLARPSKLVCVGLNYASHAAETGMEVPAEPVLFFKATSSIVGPNDDVIIPLNSKKTDWEVELAVVIEKKASYISKEEAMDYVAGYVLHNDYSERAFQLEGTGQWVKGKSCDTFAPLGPCMVTKDEIQNPHDLKLWLKVNGELLQNSNTSDFIFDIPHVVSYISQYMTLLPGDVISTGTPFGVGMGFNPPRYLKAGDVVELGIEGLGTSKQHAIAYS
ncbi:fumarylacetoacetate hydrolase family protein [Aegicerativicinus sediminis]|uniref:fumarylacetoacetate hydrolase family protein n=1 Tax=Aegicerativicinus sediminis TaxID=2893202 RepID=UPI001E6090C2|nr:fumarylacetoacetate hydrolase family protein [Aegicerativicinus sediminis]